MIMLSESTINLLLSVGMGLLGGLVMLPINSLIAIWLKRDEIAYQHKLDLIAKQRELLLQHKLEMERHGRKDELANLEARIGRLEKEMFHE